MEESLPVVTLPGEDQREAEGANIEPEDIVVLQEVVVEELQIEGELGPEEDEIPLPVVTEPADDVIVLGSSEEEEEEEDEEEEEEEDEEEEEEEEVEEKIERVAGGSLRGGMATDAGAHPVSLPPVLPVEDVPPDETITAEMCGDGAGNGAGEVAKGGDVVGEVTLGEDDGARVVSKVMEKKVTVVEETVTTVEEVVVATGEVVGRTVTDSVKVDEVLSVNETVAAADAMETDVEKAEKKRLRDEEEDSAVKRSKSDVGEEADGAEGMDEDKVVEPKKLGPKVFNTPVEMFSYFYNLLHDWSLNLNVNKYEFMVLSELIKQGNPQKEGEGIASIQVRMHTKFQSRCYYVIRKDGSEDDFSYRKCVDALMPLPASLYRSNGELDLEKLFPGQKRRHREQNGGGRGGGRGDRDRGHRGGGGGRGYGSGYGGRGGGGRGGRGGGGRRGGRGKW